MSSTACANARPPVSSVSVTTTARSARVVIRHPPKRKKRGRTARPRCEGYYWRAGLTRPAFFVCLELELEPRAEANLLRRLVADVVDRIADRAEVRVDGAKA